MPDHPLLVFPEPTHAERAKRQGFPNRLRKPDPGEQAQRLAPQMQHLQEAMDRRRLLLQDNPMGIQPEQVLVLETVGSIDTFVNAVRRIEGLEWLGEFEQSEIEPEFGFAHDTRPDRPLRGQLFLIMTNQQALRQLRSLFDTWQNDQEIAFPHGLARLKEAFRYLLRIRPWSAERIEFAKPAYWKIGRNAFKETSRPCHLKQSCGLGTALHDGILQSHTS